MEQEQMSLAIFEPIRATLAELEKKDESLVFDHTMADGEKELRSWVKRIRGFKGDVARAHKETKANALAFGRKIDAIKNELTTGADKLITQRMLPLDKIEAKKRTDAEAIVEAERVEKERIETVRLEAIAKQEEEIARKQAELKAQEEKALQVERNRQAKIKVEEDRIAREREKLEAEKKAEADARQREINARKQAELEKQQAIEKAECEKAEAIEAEKEKARKVEVDRLAEEAEQRAKANRLAKIEADRISNENHRRQIEQDIIDAIVIMLGSESDVDAQEIVDAIVQGEIPNVTINY